MTYPGKPVRPTTTGTMTQVVVVGGANLDIKARTTAALTARTSNPGVVSMSPGGVGRNIAENLARLGTSTRLVCALGRDDSGTRLASDTLDAGVVLDALYPPETRTGTYVAVLDAEGDLVAGVADMGATDAIGAEAVSAAAEAIVAAAMVVLDGNLPLTALRRALELAGSAGVPVVVDPVSVAKAARIAPYLAGVFAVTPNLEELAALTGTPVEGQELRERAVGELLRRGVQWVWVRMGAQGSVLNSVAGSTPIEAVPTTVRDVTGAGDSSLAAFVHGLLTGMDPEAAARLGHRAASLTIASEHTVRPDIAERLQESR